MVINGTSLHPFCYHQQRLPLLRASMAKDRLIPLTKGKVAAEARLFLTIQMIACTMLHKKGKEL